MRGGRILTIAPATADPMESLIPDLVCAFRASALRAHVEAGAAAGDAEKDRESEGDERAEVGTG